MPKRLPSEQRRPLPPVEAHRLAARFKLLADPTRLRLLSIPAANEETCVCDLVGVLGVSQPTVSYHLKLLKGAGMVDGDARGGWTYYRLTDAAHTVLPLLTAVV